MKRSMLCLGLILALTACGGGSGTNAGSDGGGDDGGGGGGGGAAPTDFTAFVKDLFDKTSDTAEPVDISGVVLENLDNQDPTAFDDLLAR